MNGGLKVHSSGWLLPAAWHCQWQVITSINCCNKVPCFASAWLTHFCICSALEGTLLYAHTCMQQHIRFRVHVRCNTAGIRHCVITLIVLVYSKPWYGLQPRMVDCNSIPILCFSLQTGRTMCNNLTPPEFASQRVSYDHKDCSLQSTLLRAKTHRCWNMFILTEATVHAALHVQQHLIQFRCSLFETPEEFSGG